MSAKPVQLFGGPAAVRAAEEVHKANRDRAADWPYPHVYPPASAVDVCVIGTKVTQAQGAAAIEVLNYTVSSGKRFFLQAVVLGANVAIVPGQALFTLWRNLPPGVLNSQAQPEHGLAGINLQLGSLDNRGWELRRAREFEQLDYLSVQAQNIGLSVGDPNYYVCGLFGFEVPVMELKTLR